MWGRKTEDPVKFRLPTILALGRRAKPAAKAIRRPAPETDETGSDFSSVAAACVLAAVLVIRLTMGASAASVAVPGDRVVFGYGTWQVPQVTVPARHVAGIWQKPGTACRLSVPMMSRRPGALTVLAVRPDGVMLSWAGGPTARAGSDCHAGGGSLLVSDSDYLSISTVQSPKR